MMQQNLRQGKKTTRPQAPLRFLSLTCASTIDGLLLNILTGSRPIIFTSSIARSKSSTSSTSGYSATKAPTFIPGRSCPNLSATFENWPLRYSSSASRLNRLLTMVRMSACGKACFSSSSRAATPPTFAAAFATSFGGAFMSRGTSPGRSTASCSSRWSICSSLSCSSLAATRLMRATLRPSFQTRFRSLTCQPNSHGDSSPEGAALPCMGPNTCSMVALFLSLPL
mmetsp:Transcript_25853/g.70126  ORF Transcript_25853/g.70126 Transcript_25853/m.70126 type:complete len:226 (-) Transcript_25853:2174-2851(-)